MISGTPAGWAKLRQAQDFKYWEAVVLEEAFTRDTNPERRRLGLAVNHFADCLVALHLGAAETAEAIMKRLVGESHEASNSYWQASTSMLGFQARLFELLTAKTLEMAWDKLLPLAGYERLLSDGCTGEDYRAAIEWGCSEHIAQTRDTKHVLQPFATGVAVAMPIELLCWLRYRRSRGLEHATYGHPLLESPLATLDPPSNAPPASELSELLELALPHMHAYLGAR